MRKAATICLLGVAASLAAPAQLMAQTQCLPSLTQRCDDRTPTLEEQRRARAEKMEREHQKRLYGPGTQVIIGGSVSTEVSTGGGAAGRR
jgi:hypothetical protein